MSIKKFPLDSKRLRALIEKYPTPFNIYDGRAIIKNAEDFKNAFSWNKGFNNYFAVKALPNINILKLMKKIGFGVDCSSDTELLLAHKCGFKDSQIMFSSNDTSDDEFRLANKLGAIINLDDITHIDRLYNALYHKFPKTISFRYNPGPDRCGNSIIGNPVEAKYGVTKDQIVDAYKKAKSLGAKHFLLHTMVASNELNREYIKDTAVMLFNLVERLKKEADIEIKAIDMGGGIGIPYRLEDEKMDLHLLGSEIHELYNEMIIGKKLGHLKITFECGRMITGPYGYLVTKVRHVTHKYKDYVGLDACMADLMRPALYGAYHHITVLDKEDEKAIHTYDVTGSLCENNDKFAVDRLLPEIKVGDILIIHDTGAHGTSMGFNYNGKMRHAEFLINEDDTISQIRRSETFKDYVATMMKKPKKTYC